MGQKLATCIGTKLIGDSAAELHATLAVPEAHLLKVLLGLVHARNIVKGYAGVGLHLELGLGLAHLHWVVAAAKAARATGAAAPARQQEQAAHQQQGEREIA
jgi:hypothetical protein